MFPNTIRLVTVPPKVERFQPARRSILTGKWVRIHYKVSVGGYVIVDDYGLKGCKAAIDDFRRERGIADPIMDLDGSCVYWRRAAKAFEMAAPARKPVQKYDVVLQSEMKA